MHMDSIKTPLSVLKALDARKTDKHVDTLGHQQLSRNDHRRASKGRQGGGTAKKTGILGLAGPVLWEMVLSAGRSLLVMLPKW